MTSFGCVGMLVLVESELLVLLGDEEVVVLDELSGSELVELLDCGGLEVSLLLDESTGSCVSLELGVLCGVDEL